MDINLIGDYLIVNFYGDLDTQNVLKHKDKLIKEINKNNFKKVAMDFSKVNFIDSSGIGLILGRYQQLASFNKKLTVYGISKNIDKLFKISGIWKIIENGDLSKEGVGLK